MLGEGNQAFIDDDIPKAVQIMQEVIRIEPRARAAWVVLANIHERDNPEKALQLRIMAAHLQHEADDWLTLARESRYSIHCLVIHGCVIKAPSQGTRFQQASPILLWQGGEPRPFKY